MAANAAGRKNAAARARLKNFCEKVILRSARWCFCFDETNIDTPGAGQYDLGHARKGSGKELDLEAKCPICGADTELRRADYPGYRAPDAYAIMSCHDCDLQFAWPFLAGGDIYRSEERRVG